MANKRLLPAGKFERSAFSIACSFRGVPTAETSNRLEPHIFNVTHGHDLLEVVLPGEKHVETTSTHLLLYFRFAGHVRNPRMRLLAVW